MILRADKPGTAPLYTRNADGATQKAPRAGAQRRNRPILGWPAPRGKKLSAPSSRGAHGPYEAGDGFRMAFAQC